MIRAISGARDRLREASLVLDVTCETRRNPEELQLPATWRNDEEGWWQKPTYCTACLIAQLHQRRSKAACDNECWHGELDSVQMLIVWGAEHVFG